MVYCSWELGGWGVDVVVCVFCEMNVEAWGAVEGSLSCFFLGWLFLL